MTLWILRHGIAQERAAGVRDDLRRLTPQGRVLMRRAAEGLVALGVRPKAIFTSPLPRAAETAAIVAAALRGRVVPRTLEALGPGTPPADILHALRGVTRAQEVMLVGHEPTLGELAALLLTGSTEGLRVRLRKGGCLALSLEALFPPAGARLEWHTTPKQLRRLAR